MSKYIGGKQASERLGVHQRTLYQWEEKGWIETIRSHGGKRLYNVDKYIEARKCEKKDKIKCNKLNELDEKKGRLSISYARVSSLGQKDDLERQILLLKKHYPNNILIKDIGSGINFNKRGLKKLIHLAIEGKIKKIVVAYKDRLTRIGFELIEDLIKTYSKGEIIILRRKDDMEPEEQLVKDVLEIMNVFVAKMNGLRKYKKK
jgi:putative resolvase